MKIKGERIARVLLVGNINPVLRRWLHRMFLVAVVGLVGQVSTGLSRPAVGFDEWLNGVRVEAVARGISEATLETALSGLQPIERVIELDRNQPEFRESLGAYMDRLASEDRARRGRELLREHASFFAEISRRYGVPPRYLVALWGIESNYGKESGTFPVIGALATLAWDDRRPDFYRAELLHALSILDEQVIRIDALRGSWSGAMGPLQFMPSTYHSFAVDGDGDGLRDIWHNLSDVFASAAYYLSRSGWESGYTWGRRVRLPDGFDLTLAGMQEERPLSEWRSMGIRRSDGNSLPTVDIEASLILPDGRTDRAYLVYANYRALLRWNRSHLFALSVCHLADRLVGKAP